MSTISTILSTIILVTNLITGATYEHETCPPEQQWQWYAAHGIWACGGHHGQR